MEALLRLQVLDLKIEACRAREKEIPNQKGKFKVRRERLAAELEEREEAYKKLQLEQREAEGDIEQKQEQIGTYEQQLLGVKNNDAYQALLHEIDYLKKQIAAKEERIIALMVELDDLAARLEEDRKRIDGELKEIDDECAKIDQELEDAVKERGVLEQQRQPLMEQVEPGLLSRYKRIRVSKKTGAAVVPLNGLVCSGCHMAIPEQIANEVLAGKKVHSCSHCGRLLFHTDNVTPQGEPAL